MRITLNNKNCKYIFFQDTTKMTRQDEYAIIRGRNRDIYTMLVYR